MSIRRSAKAWLASHGVQLRGPLYTSKLYIAEHSWTGAPAWWVKIPIDRLAPAGAIEIICEPETPDASFHHLTVPAAFLSEQLESFGLIGENSVNLFLSAEPDRRFTDLRGPGRVDFSPFQRNHLNEQS